MQMPSVEQIEEGLVLKENMQIWPLEGSIVETQNSIVIYLSEPGRNGTEQIWEDKALRNYEDGRRCLEVRTIKCYNVTEMLRKIEIFNN